MHITKLEGSNTMETFPKAGITVNNQAYDSTQQGAFDALYGEFAKGMQSMKNGEVYTIEEAWKEIDKV